MLKNGFQPSWPSVGLRAFIGYQHALSVILQYVALERLKLDTPLGKKVRFPPKHEISPKSAFDPFLPLARVCRINHNSKLTSIRVPLLPSISASPPIAFASVRIRRRPSAPSRDVSAKPTPSSAIVSVAASPSW